MINESTSKEPLIASQDKKEKLPKEKLMTRMIKDEFRFERRTYIFLNVNTINLVLTIYNLVSPINIEGQRSLIYYEDTRDIENKESGNTQLLGLINALIVVHLLRVFTCMVGYFSTAQKSGRIITYFMILSTICVLARGIVSLLIILNFSSIKDTCESIFSVDGQNVGELMAYQFLIVLLVFVVVEIFLALISLVQCSKSKEEYAVAVKQKEKLLKNYNLCYEVVINQLDE
ncbi:hypothetical protein pb186bvf_014084 [Paramecium bursaria]